VLARIARLTFQRPKLVLGAVLAFVIVAGAFGHDVEHHLKAAGFTDSRSQSERGTRILRDALGYDAQPGIALIVRAKGGGALGVKDPAVAQEVNRIAGALRDTRFVGHVANPLQGGPPALIAQDGRSVVLAAFLSTQDIESDGGAAAEDAMRRIGASSLDVRMGGFAPSFNEVNDQTRDDLTTAELIAFPILSILLLIVFRGVIAAAIPLAIGVASILGTFLALRIMAGLVDTSLFALNIGSALSLGLAVDYALLMISRFREEIEHSTVEVAHRRMVETAGRTALFSGFTVAVAMLALVLFPQRFLYSIGVAGAVVGALSATLAVLVVPSLLALLGPRINTWSVRGGPSVSAGSDRWYRIAAGVLRRPALAAVLTTGLMLALAAPLFGAHLTGPSAQAIPPGKPSYIANQLIDADYPHSITQAITVAETDRSADLDALSARIGALRGIASPVPFTRTPAGVAYANFAPAGLALSDSAQDAVRRIRALSPSLLVSGNTARFIDEKQSLVDHLPLVALVVSLSTFVLLFMLTGSVVLPLKALVMNTMTLAATLGVLVLAFQVGILDTPFDYTGPDAVEVTSLVFLFAVIFGLATDYAVLVLARIKEQHDAGTPNDEAVAIGIGRTGRVISAAALMIAVVFLAFGVSSVFFMKQLAVGQAVGVLLDATVVRALLVPALMGLLGDWNWWAPRPMRRFHARWGIQEG
jgi:RND superfamily putative drug exporter